MMDPNYPHMYMVLWFGCDCAFVIDELKTSIHQCGLFFVGCLVIFLYSVFHMWLSRSKQFFLNKFKNGATIVETQIQPLTMKQRLILSLWYFLFSASNILIMLFMMTMNGWVEIALALGLALGYLLFHSKDALPIENNACHIE